MNTKAAQLLRSGGLSRRGFLRALGLTTCATLVPGLLIPEPVGAWEYVTGFTQKKLKPGQKPKWHVEINGMAYALELPPMNLRFTDKNPMPMIGDESPLPVISISGMQNGMNGTYRVVSSEKAKA